MKAHLLSIVDGGPEQFIVFIQGDSIRALQAIFVKGPGQQERMTWALEIATQLRVQRDRAAVQVEGTDK